MPYIKTIAFSVFLISFVLTGCSEDIYEGDYKPALKSYYLSVSPRDFEFTSGADTKTGSIKSENNWTFSNVPEWLSLTPESGNSDKEFSITSAINEKVSSRTAVFNLSSSVSEWSQQRTITATQEPAAPLFRFVNLENTSLYLNGQSHSITIDVETNLDDLAVKTYGGEGWLNASYRSGQLLITVGANDNDYQRSGRVELWSSSCSMGGTIYITQYKPNLSFNEITSLSFDADGGAKSVKVSSEIPWLASSNESWIEIQPSKGSAGDNQVNVTVLPSYQSGDRNGRVLFYYKDNQSAVDYIPIIQSGRYLNITPKSITMPTEENSSETINIDSNIGWITTECPEWITLNQNSGNAGNSNIKITVSKNNSLNARSGNIVFSDSYSGGIQSKLYVKQNALDLGGQTTLEFSWHQSSLPLEIPLPGEWNATVSDGWISLSDYVGSGNKKISVSVSRNDSEDPRDGTIRLTSEGKRFDIKVIQNGQYLKIDNTSGDFDATGGIMNLTLSSSVDTSYRIDYSSSNENWITVNEINKEEYQLNIASNPSSNERRATFVISPKDTDVNDVLSQGVKVFIKQKGRELLCDVSKIDIRFSGGTSQTYKIKADGKYSISKSNSDTWFTIVSDSETNTFYIVVTENTSTDSRVGYITLSLDNLPQGESKTFVIEVLQVAPGIHVSFGDFNFEDEIIW